MRDEGLEPDPDISFFLIACPADHLAAARLLGEDSCGRDAPESADSGEEGDESADGCSARLRTLNIEVLEDYGEADMARLLREAPEDYYRRYEAGRLKVHGPRLEHDGGEVDRAGGLLK
jgi:hypothetical protein